MREAERGVENKDSSLGGIELKAAESYGKCDDQYWRFPLSDANKVDVGVQ